MFLWGTMRLGRWTQTACWPRLMRSTRDASEMRAIPLLPGTKGRYPHQRGGQIKMMSTADGLQLRSSRLSREPPPPPPQKSQPNPLAKKQASRPAGVLTRAGLARLARQHGRSSSTAEKASTVSGHLLFETFPPCRFVAREGTTKEGSAGQMAIPAIHACEPCKGHARHASRHAAIAGPEPKGMPTTSPSPQSMHAHMHAACCRSSSSLFFPFSFFLASRAPLSSVQQKGRTGGQQAWEALISRPFEQPALLSVSTPGSSLT